MLSRNNFFQFTLFCFLLVFVVCLYVLFSKPNYFQILDKKHAGLALQKLHVDSCDQFLKSYIQDQKLEKDAIRAAAYEMGLCVKQDLGKAKDLYEAAYDHSGASFMEPLRLTILYEFGPESIRNKDRAEFMARQAAISLSIYPDEIRKQMLKGVFSQAPMPANMRKQLIWLHGVSELSAAERENLRQSLAEQGFKNAENLMLGRP